MAVVRARSAASTSATSGPTGWVRLQWDTAPPLLMGASIVRTDLPGAIIDPAGLYIAYDVAYQVADRFTMKAQVSYGARDGCGPRRRWPGHRGRVLNLDGRRDEKWYRPGRGDQPVGQPQQGRAAAQLARREQPVTARRRHRMPRQRRLRPDAALARTTTATRGSTTSGRLRQLCKERGAEFNLEGDDREELIALAEELDVTQFTLVPVKPGEITSDHGWDLPRQHDVVAPIVERLKAKGIRTAIFVDPNPEMMPAAAATGVDRDRDLHRAVRVGVGQARAQDRARAAEADGAGRGRARA